MQKVLTIGIAAYNVESTIEDCINSMLIDEIADKLEVLVINDGSTDSTKKIVNSYVAKYPNTVKLVDKENGGHGSTINATIDNATGKYLKMVDGDDRLEKTGLISLMKELESTAADMVFSPYYRVNINTGKKELVGYLKNIQKRYLSRREMSLDKLSDKLVVAMHSVTYKTTLLKNSRYRIDEHCFYVDVEYSLYYLLDVHQILLLDVPVYDYSIGDVNQSINKAVMRKRREQHMKVCKSLIDFYESEKNSISVDLRVMLKNNIINMILCNEYMLLMSLEDDETSSRELQIFDLFLKENSLDLYNGVIILNSSKKFKLLKFWRKNNFFGYRFMHTIFKKQFVNW